jgi:hypothetical protein
VAAAVRVVAVASLSSLLLSPMLAGVQSVTCVVIVAKAVMYWGRGGLPTVVHRLVGRCSLAMVLGRLFLTMRGQEDGYVITVSCQWHTLASIASLRRRALHLLYRRALL